RCGGGPFPPAASPAAQGFVCSCYAPFPCRLPVTTLRFPPLSVSRFSFLARVLGHRVRGAGRAYERCGCLRDLPCGPPSLPPRGSPPRQGVPPCAPARNPACRPKQSRRSVALPAPSPKRGPQARGPPCADPHARYRNGPWSLSGHPPCTRLGLCARLDL